MNKYDLDIEIYQRQKRILHFMDLKRIIKHQDNYKIEFYIKTKRMQGWFDGAYTIRTKRKIDLTKKEMIELLDLAMQKEQDGIDECIDGLISAEIERRENVGGMSNVKKE